MNFNKIKVYSAYALGLGLIAFGVMNVASWDFGFDSLQKFQRSKSGYTGLFLYIGGGIGIMLWGLLEDDSIEVPEDKEKAQEEHENQ